MRSEWTHMCADTLSDGSETTYDGERETPHAAADTHGALMQTEGAGQESPARGPLAELPEDIRELIRSARDAKGTTVNVYMAPTQPVAAHPPLAGRLWVCDLWQAVAVLIVAILVLGACRIIYGTQLAQLHANYGSATDELGRVEMNLNLTTLKNDQMIQQLQDTRQELLDAKLEAIKLKTRQEALQDSHSGLSSSTTRLQDSLDATQRENTELKGQLMRSRESLATHQAEVSSLSKSNTRLQKQLDTAQRENAEVKGRLAAARETLATHQADLNNLSNSNRASREAELAGQQQAKKLLETINAMHTDAHMMRKQLARCWC